MSIRVHDLAKRCGLSNKEMIEKLHAINYPIKSHSSTVDNITAEALEKEYGYVPPAPEPPPAPVAPPPPPPEPVVVAAPAPAAPVAPPLPVVVAPPPPVAPIAKVTLPPPPPPPAPVVVAPPAAVAPAVKPVIPIPRPPPLKAPLPVPVVANEPPFVVDAQGNKVIHMKPPVVVRDLAYRIGKKPHLLLMELMELNVFANLNETIVEDVARKICERHGFKFELEKRERGGGAIHPPKVIEVAEPGEKQEDLDFRPPVVTFMGHVDHGKTSLLDAIRKTKVAAGESGGITQHIGASVVQTADGKNITFLDTPGHEAFTKMRSRGATVTDIVVLVVAADDGFMPQTVEALNHAKAAKVAILVAINKCDLPAANPDRVRKQLQEQGLTPESWGGDTITVEVSATTKKGIEHLLEMILLQAEMLQLKASPKAPAKGHVIEAQLEPGMGPTATVLVSKGTLKVGDAIISGPHWAKIRALIDDKGQRVKQAGPSTPVKIVGLSGTPGAGVEFSVMRNEKEARQLSEQRQLAARAGAQAEQGPRTTLEDFLGQTAAAAGKVQTLNLVIKADVQGSLEALNESLGKLPSEKIQIEIIHGVVGSINENDVLLASASNAIIVGFRVKLESGVSDIAKREGVQIKLYTIIYELIEQVEEAMKGLLSPESKETTIGQAEVKQVFELTKGPKIAGCLVTNGRISRSGRARVVRRRAVQFEGKLASLRHFQDDVKDVKAGQECGLRLENFTDYQPGDIIECYSVEKVAAKL